jgi:hypothetical protein
MPVKLNSTGGGSVTLTTPSTATDYTATFPDNTGNVVTDSAIQTLTNKTLTSPTISSPSITGNLTSTGSISDSKGDVRTIVQNAQTGAYVLVAADAGKHISITTGGVTVNTSIFSAGDAISIYNNSASNQTITQGASVTMYLGGTATTGNRTLAQRGICTILCVASNTFVISGAGLT